MSSERWAMGNFQTEKQRTIYKTRDPKLET
jgi:hypothetical protein